ncbi:MAG TPA: hypothetical protein VHD82_05860 [Amycolatopsis sp.]|nr:hypothetical protein [Amycolatopsis sp.]HVV08770.1 hypothetical protein [Amycolatopsis sp.]
MVVAALAFAFRASFRQFAETITNRVRQGASFEVGASKMRLGPASPQKPSGPEPEPGAQPMLDASSGSVAPRPDSTGAPDVLRAEPEHHQPENELRVADFGMGMFNLTADVHIAGRQTPLRLERYINF